jgi:hypothetical protein
MQNLWLKLSLYFNRSYFTGTKIARKDDYEESKEQNGCRSSSRTIATKAQMMHSETDELHEPILQTVGTFLKTLSH